MARRDSESRRWSARLGIASALLLALLVLAALAGAKKTKVASTVEVLGATPSFQDPEKAYVFGKLTAEARRCVANRKVAVTVVQADATRVKLGTTRTSENGGWAIDGAIKEFIGNSDFDYAIAKAKKRAIKLKGKRNKLVCGTDTDQGSSG